MPPPPMEGVLHCERLFSHSHPTAEGILKDTLFVRFVIVKYYNKIIFVDYCVFVICTFYNDKMKSL